MKLNRVSLLEDTDFRSLPKNFSIQFSKQGLTDIDPKCIVGLNGSGKSNLLELVAEIFFHIEMSVLHESEITNENFAFEIEYTYPMLIGNPHVKVGNDFLVGDNLDIKITKTRKKSVKIFLKSSSKENKYYTRIKADFEQILPNKIIGYSSGQNELLSNPFLKMKFHYIEKFRLLKKSDKPFNLEESRLFWMDYSNNNAIILSNLLISNNKNLKLLMQEVGVYAIESFKVVIDYSKSDRTVPLSKQLDKNIEKLKSCTPFWYEQKDKSEKISKIVMDFKVVPATLKAFKHHFGTSQKLFEVFYQLELFNLYTHKTNLVEKVISDKDKSLNVSEEIPYNPQKQIFSLKNIRLKKFLEYKTNKLNRKIINYKNLSDGEHQFLQVFGSMMMLNHQGNLFLFDEPETHFNPIWRSKMVTIINLIAKSKEKVAQEILLTTHSPYILSDSKRKNIFLFLRNKENIIECKTIDFTTFGSSIGYIMKKIFSQNKSIGTYSESKLLDLINNVTTVEDYERSIESLNNFGDSIEKFNACRQLAEKKNKLD